MSTTMSLQQPLLQESQVLRLHTGPAGDVWGMDGTQPPTRVGTFGEFIESPLFAGATNVRVPGMRRNVPLILTLHQRRQEQRLARVEVGSPLMGRTRQERDNPQAMLLRMREVSGGVPSSLGGWHEFVESDYPSYQLAAQLDRNGDKFDDQIGHLLHAHPAWKFLDFMPHLNPGAVARLLAEILDPRWFVDRERPDSPAKLRAFTGLRAQTVAAVRAGDVATDTARRCQLTMQAWQGDGPTEAAAKQPGYCLWRKWFTIEDPQLATQRVSQDFITFLRLTWLDAIMAESGRATDWLFDPEQFFKKDDDAIAFRQHRGRVSRR